MSTIFSNASFPKGLKTRVSSRRFRNSGLKDEHDSLIVNLEGKEINVGVRRFSWVKSRLVKRGDIVIISYFYSPQFILSGKLDLKSGEVRLSFEGNWQEESITLDGKINARVKIWGELDNFFASGSITMEEGRYQTREFSKICLNFLGKPPLLNLTDSRCILKDGSIYGIEGVMDLTDFTNLIPEAEFTTQKVSFGEWKLLSKEEKNIGLKKDVDRKFDILFDMHGKEDSLTNAGSELRYKIDKDRFLRLRMQEDKSIVGFEKRKEF